MIAKDLMPWMFVKRTAAWTPYVKIRSEHVRCETAALPGRPGRKPGRRPPQALRSEDEQQPERVAVGRDGVWTRAELRVKPVGEEVLEERREIRRGHRASPRAAVSRRSVARRRSSGTAWMYQ